MRRWVISWALAVASVLSVDLPASAHSRLEVGWDGLECLLGMSFAKKGALDTLDTIPPQCSGIRSLSGALFRSWVLPPNSWQHWKGTYCGSRRAVFCEAGGLVESGLGLGTVDQSRKVAVGAAARIMLARWPGRWTSLAVELTAAERRRVDEVVAPLDWWLASISHAHPTRHLLSSLDVAGAPLFGLEALAPFLQFIDRDGMESELEVLLASSDEPRQCDRLRRLWRWSAPTLQPAASSVHAEGAQLCLSLHHPAFVARGGRPPTRPSHETFNLERLAGHILLRAGIGRY